MAYGISKIRSWISGDSQTQRDKPGFLPQDSVVIRTREANILGAGSFAKVYRGEYSGKPCAVKVFMEHVLRKETSIGGEVEMLSEVQHPNIVRVYGMWYDPHKERAAASIVMELCDESLYEFIRRSQKGKLFSEDKKFTILRDIARGMVYLHGQNIIHGDLRSSNIFLIHSEDKTAVKLADFDMARLLTSDMHCNFTTRFTAKEYLPPEVFDHKERKHQKAKQALFTPKVDVFCFGEVALEMGCGTYPTPDNKYRGPEQEMLTELQRRDKHLVQLKQSDKESLGVIIQKCLTDAPNSRPTFTDILHDVEGYMHKYGERPDLEKLQDKTAECEALRAQVLMLEDHAKDLVSTELQGRVDMLERELDMFKKEKQDLQSASERFDLDNMKLQDEKAALDKQVRDLTTTLQVRMEDLDKNKHDIYKLEKELEEVQKANAEGCEADTALREYIDELTEEKKDLMDQLEREDTKLQKVQKELTEAMETQRALEGDLDQKGREIRELEKMKEQFQLKIAAAERTDTAQQQKFKEAQQKEQDLNAKVRKLQDDLEAMQSTIDKLEQYKGTAEEEKFAYGEQVRELAFRLEVRKEDLCKKEEHIFRLNMELEEARKAIADGKSLEPKLRQTIEELEENNKDLMDKLEKSVNKLEQKKELIQALEWQEMLKQERDQNAKALCDLKQKLEEAQQRELKWNAELQLHRDELEALQKGKAVLEKDLARARKMCRDLVDEGVKVNEEREQKMGNLNEKLVEFKQQAALSEEHLGQSQGLKEEERDLKLQLKTLTATLEDFQKLVTSEQKSCKLLDASVKTLSDEVTQLRTEIKERNEEVGSLAATNKRLQSKADAADTTVSSLRDEVTQLRTELKERSEEVGSLAATNKRLQRKADAADTTVSSLRSEVTILNEQVKYLMKDNQTLKQALDGAEAAVQKHKIDYTDSQKLREAEHPITMLRDGQQKLDVLEGLAEEFKTQLSGLKMDAYRMSPTVSTEGDGTSATVLARGSTQKREKKAIQKDVKRGESLEPQLWKRIVELKKDNKNLMEEHSALQGKLQASQSYAEQLEQKVVRAEAEKDGLQQKASDANDLIMQHLLRQDKVVSPELLPARTEFHAMMEFFKDYYDRASKQSEQTAEENQQLLTSNMELNEKLKELQEASQALTEKLSENQQCLEEQQSEITVLKAQLSSLQKVDDPPLLLQADVDDMTADEVRLQELCYMATGFKQLHISPDGGTFILGTGDATLEVPLGAVEKETSVRYATILHGPFVFTSGHKPVSTVLYINMDGATLLKPVYLLLSHWCVREEDGKEALKFVHAPHTLEAGQQNYTFEECEEEEADFVTRVNVGVLTIRKPHCLFCVETKIEKTARYNAIAFSRYDSSEETLLFRIQLMCDALEWNKKLTTVLQQKNWEMTSGGDVVTRFQYADGQHQITASPCELAGPGWKAVIYGQQAVKDQMFLEPLGKSKEEVEGEVNNGRFPPCILYKIIYTGREELRVNSALVNVLLQGADVPLSFSCRVKEEMTALPPLSPASSEPVSGAATFPSPMDNAPVSTGDILKALDHRLDAKWRHFGTFLSVDYQIMESIQRDKGGNPADCMLDLLSKWASSQSGTGTLPRTWQTVVEAIRNSGDVVLADTLALKHGGHLSH